MRNTLLAVVFFFTLLAILLIQNAQVVTFRFLVWTIRMPQMASILILVGVGFVLGILAAAMGKKKKKKK